MISAAEISVVDVVSRWNKLGIFRIASNCRCDSENAQLVPARDDIDDADLGSTDQVGCTLSGGVSGRTGAESSTTSMCTFRTNEMRLNVTKILDRVASQLKKSSTLDDPVKLIYSVMHSNDCIARALTLRFVALPVSSDVSHR